MFPSDHTVTSSDVHGVSAALVSMGSTIRNHNMELWPPGVAHRFGEVLSAIKAATPQA